MQVCLWDLSEGRSELVDSVWTDSVGFCQCSLLESSTGNYLLAFAGKQTEEVRHGELKSVYRVWMWVSECLWNDQSIPCVCQFACSLVCWFICQENYTKLTGNFHQTLWRDDAWALEEHIWFWCRCKSRVISRIIYISCSGLFILDGGTCSECHFILVN